ncbi:PEP-CTERM sorting domain-containing protein [Duganella fentianensis]|uniref:PEP-CTERM sorting domain-containing protein n=1 Tax=Duganella fentianensis TaxID=2692177 RepID=UPI0032B24797
MTHFRCYNKNRKYCNICCTRSTFSACHHWTGKHDFHQVLIINKKGNLVVKSISSIFAALTLSFASSAMAQNIVQNPGFEEGYTGWNVSGFSIGDIGAGYAHSGTWLALTGCITKYCVYAPATGAYIAQTLNTTAGTSYSLSFLVSENGGPTSEMSIYWNGALVADVINPANNTWPGHWVQFNYTNLVATSKSTVLEIHGRQDPSLILFDDISVTAAVPEPSSYAMLMAGLGALSLIAKRRRSLVCNEILVSAY